MTLIRQPTPENIFLAARNLKNGALIGLPTETVYGLAADAENETAVRRIYEVKGRPFDHPLIVHIGSIEYLDKWARDIPESAWHLANEFWPGPMTLILKRSKIAKNFITGNQESIAIRYPSHKVAQLILEQFHEIGGKGLAAPSANKFGAVSPTNALEVEEDIGTRINSKTDIIVDGGKCILGLESTIINCTSKYPEILRSGFLTRNRIAKVLKIADSDFNSVSSNSMRFPGKYARHYSPRTKILINKLGIDGDGFIALDSIDTPKGLIRLSNPKNTKEFAQTLYESFRLADKLKIKQLTIILPENDELTEVIADRVSRAAGILDM